MRPDFNLKTACVAIVYSLLFLANSVVFAGTGDLAGGANGSNNAIYESNIKTIETLNIYPHKLKPIFDRFDQVMNDLTQSKEDQTKNIKKKGFSFSKFLLKWKTWYFTKDDLNVKGLNKELLGIIFNKETTQQIAINYKKEIWINKITFDKMTEDEQVDLIIHEFVMNLYFLKFYSIYEICTIGVEMGEYSVPDDETASNCESVKHIKYFNSKQTKVISEDDYQNIRRVTDWFLNELKSATPEMLYNKLKYNNFDVRLISEPNNLNNKIKISSNEIYKLLNNFVLTESFGDHCFIYGINTKLDCQASFSVKMSKFTGKYFEFSISTNDKGTQKIIPFTPGIITQSENYLNTTNGINYFPIFLNSNEFPIKWNDTVGDRFYTMVLFISPSNLGTDTSYNLIGFIIIPKVITAMNETISNSNLVECEVESLNSQKNSIYYWTKFEMEFIVEIYSNFLNWNKSYCQKRTDEDLKQLEIFQNKKSTQIKPLIGKTYELQSKNIYHGNSLQTLSQKRSMNKSELEKEYELYCSNLVNSQKNTNNSDIKNFECLGVNSIKFLDLDTVLVNNKHHCRLTLLSDSDLKNEKMRIHSYSGTDSRFILYCNQSKNEIQFAESFIGNFVQNSNSLTLREHIWEYANIYYSKELVFKELKP